MVSIPSQGGIDSPNAILDFIKADARKRGLKTQELKSGKMRVGLVVELGNVQKGAYVLNAVVDTAPVGNPDAWEYPPFSAIEKDGWLYGRGAADSKVAAAIFMSLAEELSRKVSRMKKGLLIFFDADEHTGKFNGCKALIEAYKNIKGVVIGYPGDDQFNIGSRGFYRVYAHVLGTSGHSGSRQAVKDNAIDTAFAFIRKLRKIDIENKKSGFPLPPKFNLTAVHGGEYFSMIPNKVTLNIDIRTTVEFGEKQAETLLSKIAAKFGPKVVLEKFESWPAFMLPKKSPLCAVFRQVFKEMGLELPFEVSGLSNSGNLLAKYGIPATAGYGVKYKNAHGTDERVLIESIPLVHEIYLRVAERLTGL